MKRTIQYLENLKEQGYQKHELLFELYNKWRTELDIETLISFLKEIDEDKRNLKSNYIGENTYSNFRGIAFEEYCFIQLERIIKETNSQKIIDLFWNENIKTEEYLYYDGKEFKTFPKYKRIDLTIGKKQKELIHPLIIISCKVWQSINWLDEDKNILDKIRNRYPGVTGYSLCLSLSISPIYLLSVQRSGLQVFNFSNKFQLDQFIKEVTEFLTNIK